MHRSEKLKISLGDEEGRMGLKLAYLFFESDIFLNKWLFTPNY